MPFMMPSQQSEHFIPIQMNANNSVKYDSAQCIETHPVAHKNSTSLNIMAKIISIKSKDDKFKIHT